MASKIKISPEGRATHVWPNFKHRCDELAQHLADDGEDMDWGKWATKLNLAIATVRKLRNGEAVIENSADKAIRRMNTYRKKYSLDLLTVENEFTVS
jgi:hypothetical protein